MALAVKTGLLHFLNPSIEKLKILTIESALYLPKLRELMPNAEIYAVVEDEDVAEFPEYMELNIHWTFLNYLETPLPYEYEFFDYIIGEHALELAANTKDMASGISFYLKPTGYFLSTFTNVRYWKVIQGLMKGDYRFLDRKPYSKQDYTRLLASSFYKDVVFAPQKHYAPDGFIEKLTSIGFENYGDDLETEIWMTKAAKSTPEILALKQMYTQEDRRILATLLHRLEYDINIMENTKSLYKLCSEKFIFAAYVVDFIQQAVLEQDRLFANIIPALDELGLSSWADELIDEMADRLVYDTRITTIEKWKNRITGQYKVNEHSGRRIKDCKNEKGFSPDKTVAFITCTNNAFWYDEALIYLDELIVPDGYGVEIIAVHDAKSMCEGYNRAMSMTSAKYKVYFHQDCFIVNDNIISEMLSIFKDKEIGAIGTIGCRNLPASGIWWDGMRVYGRVIHACEAESVVDSEVQRPTEEFIQVEAVDGLCIVTQQDTKWREDLFDGWHFYDVSQCKELARRGFKTVVPRQDNCWCIHCPKEKPLDKAYKGYNKIFLKEYGKELNPEI